MDDHRPPDIADRARKLIALAASSSLEEARTAAWQAARLIRDHGLVIAATAPSPPAEPAVEPAAAHEPPRHFASKYSGTCRACAGPYWIGDRIMWGKGRGTTHANPLCAEFWLTDEARNA